MPREISLAAMRAMLAQSTSEVFIELLVVDHPDMAEPIRLCNNAVAVRSNGETYQPFGFFAELPADEEDREPRCVFTVSNVDRQIVQLVRGLAGRPTFTISVVAASTPDVYEFAPHPFSVLSVRGDAQTLVFETIFSEFVQEAFPALSFSPVHFPALHKRTT
ncbi:MAG: DUF1833 family protein [Gammaproteobacteria bacterium]